MCTQMRPILYIFYINDFFNLNIKETVIRETIINIILILKIVFPVKIA